MVEKVADGIGVTKIHAQSHAGILKSFTVVVGNVDGIAKKWLIDRLAAVINQQEMQLMNMERVQFAGAVFDDPVLNCSLLHDDVRKADLGSNGAGVWPSTVM